MTETLPAADAALALAEAKAYLRITLDDDDALLTGLLGTAAGHCAAIIGRRLIVADTTEIIPASFEWRRLTSTPVVAITGVTALPIDDDPVALGIDDYAIDIDANGDGWVRVTDAGGAKRVRVALSTGMAADWSGLPEPIRQAIIRSAAHLFVLRDAAEDPGPPDAVAALLRPWCRMRLK